MLPKFVLIMPNQYLDELRSSDTAEINNLLNLQKGIISKSKGNYDLASAIFKTIIAKPDNEAILNSRTEALYQIGTIEATKDKYNLALNYLNKALELSIKNKNPDQESNILLALSSVYDKMLDKNNAYLLFETTSQFERKYLYFK